MAKDFRADQIRFHTIIASGTAWPTVGGSEQESNLKYHPHLGMVIMSASNAQDHGGTMVDAGMFEEFGNEPWLVFSGTANTGEHIDKPVVSPGGSAVLFMGDVIISGTLFGKRQVINVDKTVDGDFQVFDNTFLSGNLFSSPTLYGGETQDALVIQKGNSIIPPRVSFRMTDWAGKVNNLTKNKDAFVVFSGSVGGRGMQTGGIALFEGDVHISGNLSGDGSGFYDPSEDIILNNSASWHHPTNTPGGTAGGPAFQEGPSFGHATTASYKPAAVGPPMVPTYVQQDRWSISGSADTNIGGKPVPSHWYSDFINSSSIDAGLKKGGFRFLVAGDGLHAGRAGGFSKDNPDKSVFTISGSGDIALDPFRDFYFDSRDVRLRIRHQPRTPGADDNARLRFQGTNTYPVHFEFEYGEVTASSGIYIPGKESSPTQGEFGQELGISFYGGGTKGGGDTAIFYQEAASGAGPKNKYDYPGSHTLIITASKPSSGIKIGAGLGDMYLTSEDNIQLRATDDINITAGYDANDTDGVINITSRGGDVSVWNRGWNRFNTGKTESTEKIFVIEHHSVDPEDTAGKGGYTVTLASSGSGASGYQNNYLQMSGSGNQGAHTIKTVGTGSSKASLTLNADGLLIMTGSNSVLIDAGPTGNNISIGTSANTSKIQVGAATTEVELNATVIDINAGLTGLIATSDAGASIHATSQLIFSGSEVKIGAKGAGNAGVYINADSTVHGVQLATDSTNIPVFLGGNASLVTTGKDLHVGTSGNPGNADVWGNLTVHGDFIKGHVITASLSDPVLEINSGSVQRNSGGGIAISSGSRVEWMKSDYGHGVGTFVPALVFGRDTQTYGSGHGIDTFLVGRMAMHAHPGVDENLGGTVPIDLRAAGFRTAAGMTVTASQVPGASTYNVKVGNTGSAGQLTLHAGTLSGGGALGPMVFSGSSYSFNSTGVSGTAQKIYLDVNDNVFFQSAQGTSNNRLDLNLATGLRLSNAPTIELGSDNLLVRQGDGTNPNGLLMKANGQTLQMSASFYSMDLSSAQHLYFNEAVANPVRWTLTGNKLELDLMGSMQGLKFTDGQNIYFASDNKYINGSGQTSNGNLSYGTSKEITVKTTGMGQSVEIFAAEANTAQGAGTGAVLIFTSSAPNIAPDTGYASLGYSAGELDNGMFTDKNEDVTLIFSGSAGNLPLKHNRGTSLFTGDVVISGSMALGEYIYHDGQENSVGGAPQTAIRFQDRRIKLISSGTEILNADGQSSIKTLNINGGQVAVDTKIYSNAPTTSPAITVIGHDNTGRVMLHNTFSDSNPNIDPANGDDVLLFFSGSTGSKYQAGDTAAATRATALFGGDVYVSGALGAGSIELSNLTLTSTSAYLRFYDANHYIQKSGTNLMFRDNSLGTAKSLTQLASLAVSDDLFSVTRTALNVPNYGMTTGSFSFDSGFDGYSDNNPRPTNLVSSNDSGAGNSDVFFFVSGAIGMRTRAPADIANQLNRRSISLFGGDVHISGTLTSDNTSFGGSLNKAYDTNDAGVEGAGLGREVTVDNGAIWLHNAAVTGDDILLDVVGSAKVGQIKIAPIADSNGFFTYGGVFVTGSAGQLGFGVGGSAVADMSMIINSNKNISIQTNAGNSRKLFWDPNEASTFIQYTNTAGSQPGPKILHIANRTASGRISFSMGSSGNTSTGSGFEGNLAVSGSLLPGFDSEYNLGSSTARWANVYTGDLHLKNNRGDWTIYEERDMLVVVNNITGKKYKMGLTPLEDDE